MGPGTLELKVKRLVFSIESKDLRRRVWGRGSGGGRWRAGAASGGQKIPQTTDGSWNREERDDTRSSLGSWFQNTRLQPLTSSLPLITVPNPLQPPSKRTILPRPTDRGSPHRRTTAPPAHHKHQRCNHFPSLFKIAQGCVG